MQFSPKINDQRGMASILTASIVMIIVGLITVGFARLMAREHRQALDRQLSTQAFYAAESGVNDARDVLQTITPVTQQVCDTGSSNPYAKNNGRIDDAKNIHYTCLIVNPNPTTLEYDNSTITPNSARVARVESADNSAINKLSIGWETEGGNSANNAGCSLGNPTASAWPNNSHGLLRVDIIPANNLNRDALVDGTMSLYLYPGAGCATATTNFAAGVSRLGVRCANNGGRDCSLVVNGLPASSIFYVRLSSLYKNVNVTLAPLNNSDAPIATKNGQALIDSTGRSNDVVRRIVTRVPTQEDGRVSAVLSSTDSICKLFTLTRNASNEIIVGDNPTCN